MADWSLHHINPKPIRNNNSIKSDKNLRIVLINVLLGFLCNTISNAQETYIKSIKLSDDRFEFANSILLDKESIYIATRGDCNGEACSIIGKLNFNGETQYVKYFEGVYGGNRNTLQPLDDTILYGSYSYPEQAFHLIKITKKSGTALFNNKYNFDSISKDKLNLTGLINFDKQIKMYGEFLDLSSETRGVVFSLSQDGTPIRTDTYQLANNKSINPLEDLQADGLGNLVFITTYRDSLFNDNTVIRKINDKGIIQKNLFFPADISLDPRPQLSVLTNKNYVFTHKTREIPENGFINVVQVVCADSAGNIVWKYNYPWKILGQEQINISNDYSIDVITSTSDGGAIIAGKIKTNRIQNRFYDDAYIGKFSVDGVLQWERRINILDGRDTLFDWCSLVDIKERPDGKGYIAVGLHTPSDTSHTNVLLVCIDNDGCIEGLECSNNHYVVATKDIDNFSAPNEVILYPNPFHEVLNINVGDNENVTINIKDVNGKSIIYEANVKGTLSVDASIWPTGIYTVTIQNQYGKITSSKVLRIL